MTEANLEAMAAEIARQEGFGPPDARPTRNHNPGDLRNWPGYPADAEGFSIFPDAATGWAKLREDLTNHAARWPGQTLLAFIAGNGVLAPPSAVWPGYAPASDSNDPVSYAAGLASALGVTPETRFNEL